MRHRGSSLAPGLSLALALSLAPGCVEGFRGSNVQVDLAPSTPSQASAGATPGAGELPANIHFRIYAIRETTDGESLFEIQRFEIHKIVDLASPCFIDRGPNVPFPGLHVSQFQIQTAEVTGIDDVANPPPTATEAQKIDAATAIQRMRNIAALGGPAGLKVVSSASAGGYPAVDADCSGSGLPPATCRDAASNARRLAQCEAAWRADPALFEGTDRVLTAPLNGTTFGMVVGVNPVTPVPVGGAAFFTDAALADVDEYAITYQTDGVADPGTLFLTGRPTVVTRGVHHVDLASPLNPTLYAAEMAIFANLGDDDVTF